MSEIIEIELNIKTTAFYNDIITPLGNDDVLKFRQILIKCKKSSHQNPSYDYEIWKGAVIEKFMPENWNIQIEFEYVLVAFIFKTPETKTEYRIQCIIKINDVSSIIYSPIFDPSSINNFNQFGISLGENVRGANCSIKGRDNFKDNIKDNLEQLKKVLESKIV